MTPFKLAAIARRHQATLAVRTPRRTTRAFTIPSRREETVAVGQLFRGLLFGIPIGAAMWLLLALLLWRVA